MRGTGGMSRAGADIARTVTASRTRRPRLWRGNQPRRVASRQTRSFPNPSKRKKVCEGGMRGEIGLSPASRRAVP
eukprot:5502033-Pleurochrysis_carterae.AAC.1